MKTFKEMYDLISTYTGLDFEEVYVDERYVNVPYKKIEEIFEESIEVAKSLTKEEATKLLVHLLKSTEANVKSRFNILCDFRPVYAESSAVSSIAYLEAVKELEKVDFASLVTTDPAKIQALLNKTKAVVAQFMTTPRTVVVYDRKPDYVPDPIQTTVSPSRIVDFDPLTKSDVKQETWLSILKEHTFPELPTHEDFEKYLKDHRMVKDYIKNEPKSKNMYKRKGFEKTFAYIKETKQSKMVGLLVGGLAIVGILLYLLFS